MTDEYAYIEWWTNAIVDEPVEVVAAGLSHSNPAMVIVAGLALVSWDWLNDTDMSLYTTAAIISEAPLTIQQAFALRAVEIEIERRTWDHMCAQCGGDIRDDLHGLPYGISMQWDDVPDYGCAIYYDWEMLI